MKTNMKLGLLFIIFFLLAGCIQSSAVKGLAKVDYAVDKQGIDHYNVAVQSPGQAKTPGSIEIQGHKLIVKTGVAYPAETIAVQHLPYWGVGLMIGGVIILGLRRFLFFMPGWLGGAVAGIGLLIIILPELINRYLGISYLVFGIAVTLFLVYWLYRHRMDALTKHQLIQGIQGIESQEPQLYEKIKPILSQYQDAVVKSEIAKTKANAILKM